MGNILTISGPRGVGKSHIMHDLNRRFNFAPIVPYTTRNIRARQGERNGVDYRFVTHQQFAEIRHTRPMFDVLSVGGNEYGTPLKDFEDVVQGEPRGVTRTVNLAANSALQLREQLGSDAVRSVFILPASWQDIQRQMRDNGIGEDQIQARCNQEPTDLTLLPAFDQIVINRYQRPDDTVKMIAQFARQMFGR